MERKWRRFSVEIKPERSVPQRRLRVGEELRHVLSGILRRGECRDPALRDASVAITEVRLGSDLRNATVFVMPLGGANASEIVAGLKRSTAFLKRCVASEVVLRHTPNLIFELDLSFDQADRIRALLARPEVERDLRRNANQGENKDCAE
jgi:ribosome-binding factor A